VKNGMFNFYESQNVVVFNDFLYIFDILNHRP